MSDLRRVLHSAYSFIRSTEVNKATASLTLDHLIQEQISKYERGSERAVLDAKGESLGNRTPYLDYLDALERDLTSVIDALNDAGDDPAKLQALGVYEVDSGNTEGEQA